MATCFIFTEDLDEEHCLSLRLDQNGHVEAPLASRSIHEARALQLDAQTIVVMPTENSGLYEIELPWLGERKARAAIPYALEDQLAQNVASLHFAFDRRHYRNNHYLVAVTDKQLLVDLLAKLEVLHLDFDVLTLDWFALNENEACVTDRGLLVYDQLFKGALRGELADIYRSHRDKNTPVMVFNDSCLAFKKESATPIDSLYYSWVAQRLLQGNKIDLCQDDLQHGSQQHTNQFWYQACAIIGVLCLISTLFFNALYLHGLKTRIAVLDQKIAVIYRVFFPHASQIISPRFRIGQLLKTGLAGSGHSNLWPLLDNLGRAYKGKQMTIEQLRFQNETLSVTLVSPNFAALEKLQRLLQQAKVKVTQSEASSHEHQVVATLELSL